MPKIYTHTTKRLAKKTITKNWKWINEFVNRGIDVGDIIHTCRGYNEVISEIIEVRLIVGMKRHHLKSGPHRGTVISDFDITTESGNNCSYIHCCSLDVTKEMILEYWKSMANSKSTEWDFGDQHNHLIEAIRKGSDPFEENGCVKKEFVIKRD